MEKGRNYLYTMRFMVLMLVTACCRVAYGDPSRTYSEKEPLVVVCDWDLPPYEFLDDGGTPSGYTIELLDKILEMMKIPHTFVLKENEQIKSIFKHHQADLFVAPSFLLHSDSCYMSNNVLSYYKTKVAVRDDAPVLHSIKDYANSKVIVLREGGQIAAHYLMEMNHKLDVQSHGPMEALTGVLNGKYDCFIWGEEPLKWKIKELNLEGLRIDELDVPIVELHIGGYDKQLIDAIDDQYARLDQKGELNILRDKWFHPELHHDNASPVLLYIAIVAAVLLVLLFLLNRLVGNKLKRISQQNSERTRLMNLALDLGGYMVAEYNPKKDAFKNIRGQLMNEQQNLVQALDTLHPEDLPDFQNKVEELRHGGMESYNLLLRRNNGTAARPHWQYLTGNCIKEHDEDEHTVYLLVSKDITKEMDEQHANRELAAKYLKAFDVSLIAMSFYDKNGKLLEMNEQMKNVVGCNDENQQFFYETLLFEAPLFREVLTPGMREVMHACQHMYYPELGLDKYLEYRIRPVFTDGGEVRYYAVTARDITGERNMYREQQAIQRQLKVTNEEVRRFETQMNYLLSNSNMFIWRSNYLRGTIEISRSLHKTETSFSLDNYLDGLSSDEVEKAKHTFFDPLLRNRSINTVRHFLYSPLTHRESWFAISGTPVYDKNGQGIGHFGVIRDVTELMRSQEELRRETTQAQQSGTLKAAFLANMTHEIRTPLNAIVGFSDLLHMANTTEERTEFIQIIRHNCDLLLRLVDDLLEISSMSEKPQRIEAEDIDFSKFFNEVCQTMARRVQEPSVSFIKDNPKETFPVRTDKERIQQVITNFVTNAVKYTHEGHIKLGYREEQREKNGERQDGIFIYCEDTGAGIPKSQQKSVFDRFVKLNDYVQGTGLGLSICKSIADGCGGDIGVMSEGDGKGSTFWLWIPRFLTSNNLTKEK